VGGLRSGLRRLFLVGGWELEAARRPGGAAFPKRSEGSKVF